VLGDLEKRLKKAKKELEKWRREPINDRSVNKEAVWSFKVDRLEEQIDLYWRLLALPRNTHTNAKNKKLGDERPGRRTACMLAFLFTGLGK